MSDKELVISKKELMERISHFFNCRTVNIDGKEMINGDRLTQCQLFMDLLKSDEEYYDYDDFRSRA